MVYDVGAVLGGLDFFPDDWNLWFVDGLFGRGKTVFLACFGLYESENYDFIVGNFHLDLPNFYFLESVDKASLLSLPKNLGSERILLLLTEAYNYFDRRYCTTTYQKEIMEAVFQIRKLGVDCVADIVDLNYLDFRAVDCSNGYFRAFGRLLDSNVFVYGLFDKFVDLVSDKYYFVPASFPLIPLDMSDVFGVYSTKEVLNNVRV